MRSDVRPMFWLQAIADDAKSFPANVCRLVIFFAKIDVEDVVMTEDYLSAKTGWSNRYVSEGISWLVNHGWLIRVRTGYRNQYGSVPSLYRRSVPEAVRLSDVTPLSEGSEPTDPPKGHTTTSTEDTECRYVFNMDNKTLRQVDEDYIIDTSTDEKEAYWDLEKRDHMIRSYDLELI